MDEITPPFASANLEGFGNLQGLWGIYFVLIPKNLLSASDGPHIIVIGFRIDEHTAAVQGHIP